jgi:hypothetical protein
VGERVQGGGRRQKVLLKLSRVSLLDRERRGWIGKGAKGRSQMGRSADDRPIGDAGSLSQKLSEGRG